MPDDRSVLRSVSWQACCPWLMLFRSFSISITWRALFLATLGTCFVSLEWRLLGSLFFGRDAHRCDAVLRPVVERNGALPGETLVAPADPGSMVPPSWKPVAAILPREPVYAVWQTVTEPLVHVFNPRLGYRELAYFSLGGLWTLAVWSFMGGAISRMAAIRWSRGEEVGLSDSLNYAQRYFLSYSGGPLISLLGILLLAIPIVLLGLIMRWEVGLVIGGVLWGLVMLAGVLMAVLAVGLLFGWPLMWGTISVEGSDPVDSLSRCYAYTFQHPLRYGFYVLVAALFGWLCWLMVSFFSDLVMDLTYWAAAWGAGVERVSPEAVGEMFGQGHSQTTAQAGGGRLIAFWVGVLKAVAASWSYAFFFVSMTGVYLLVRQHADGTETNEIYIVEDHHAGDLRPQGTDESGMPEAAERSAEKAPDMGSAAEDAPGATGVAAGSDDSSIV